MNSSKNSYHELCLLQALKKTEPMNEVFLINNTFKYNENSFRLTQEATDNGNYSAPGGLGSKLFSLYS